MSLMKALRTALVQHYSDGELRTLCADLGIDYESLPGSGKVDKARELVAYAQRHGRLEELLTTVRHERPHVSLPAHVPPAALAPDAPARNRLVLWGVAVLGAALLVVAVARLLPAVLPGAPTGSAPSPTVQGLEQALAEANIQLSDAGPEQEQNVRDYIAAPNRAYYLLGVNSLRIIGDRRFTQPLYLDELDDRYTRLAGETNYLAGVDTLHEAELRQAILDAWNNHYGEQQTSLDAILGPRP
jgi:hypothetical protein